MKAEKRECRAGSFEAAIHQSPVKFLRYDSLDWSVIWSRECLSQICGSTATGRPWLASLQPWHHRSFTWNWTFSRYSPLRQFGWNKFLPKRQMSNSKCREWKWTMDYWEFFFRCFFLINIFPFGSILNPNEKKLPQVFVFQVNDIFFLHYDRNKCLKLCMTTQLVQKIFFLAFPPKVLCVPSSDGFRRSIFILVRQLHNGQGS